MFGERVDLNEDPSLFFAFTGASVLDERVHDLLYKCLSGSQRIEDESINHVNEQGFTPMLWYIKEALSMKNQALQVIHRLSQNHDIDNSSIVEALNQNNNNQIIGNVENAEIKKLYKIHVTEPFIKFLRMLLDHGANPNAYVLKLK